MGRLGGGGGGSHHRTQPGQSTCGQERASQAHSVAYGISTVHKEAQCIKVSLQGTSDKSEAAPTGFTDLPADIQQLDLPNWN